MLQQAGEYSANASAAAGGFDRNDAVITRHALKLDEKGWKELAKAGKRWLVEMDKIEKASKTRVAKDDPHGAFDVGLILMLFEAVPFSEGRPGKKKGATAARRARR